MLGFVIDVVGFLFGERNAVVDHEGADFVPEGFVLFLHLGDEFRVFGSDVFGLRRIVFHVVEDAFDEPEALVSHGVGFPFEVIGIFSAIPAGDVLEEKAVVPFRVCFLDERSEASSFEEVFFRKFGSCEIGESGEDVEVAGDGIDGATFFDYAIPLDEKWNADSAFVDGAFEAFHICIVGHHRFAVLISAHFDLRATVKSFEAAADPGHAVV